MTSPENHVKPVTGTLCIKWHGRVWRLRVLGKQAIATKDAADPLGNCLHAVPVRMPGKASMHAQTSVMLLRMSRAGPCSSLIFVSAMVAMRATVALLLTVAVAATVPSECMSTKPARSHWTTLPTA